MPGAKGQQSVAVAISGKIRIDAPADGYTFAPSSVYWTTPPTLDSMYVGFCLTVVKIDCTGHYRTGAAQSSAPPGGPPFPFTTAVWLGIYAEYTATIEAPGGLVSMAHYAVWASDAWTYAYAPGSDTYIYVATNYLELDWSFSLSNAFTRGSVSETLPSGQAYLRHPCQRTGSRAWYGDSSTVMAATFGPLSLTWNYGLHIYGGTGESLLTFPFTLDINYYRAPTIHKAYGTITVNAGAAGDPQLINMGPLTFYQDTDATGWHWHGSSHDPAYTAPPDDAHTYWKTVPSGGGITIHRCAAASPTASIIYDTVSYFRSVRVMPRLWKQNKAPGSTSYEPYSSYDTSAGHPFNIDRYRKWVGGVQQTEADVSVAPLFSGYYGYSECYTAGIPDDVWREFNNLAGGFRCWLRKDWLVANGEDVTFTEPLSTVDYPYTSEGTTYPLTDIRVPATFHNLLSGLCDSPWSSDWMSWARTELNLDKPDGTNRPSEWLGSAGDGNFTGETWKFYEANSARARVLASRRPYRMLRFGAHLWTGNAWDDEQEVDHSYPLLTRANGAFYALDDPAWWTAVCGWSPAGSYSIGRIDTYEGVECSGECDQFTQRFFVEKFGVHMPTDWYQGFMGGQMANIPENVHWYNASAGDPLPGDMVFLDDPTQDANHVGICHAVTGGEIYIANANHDDDELGYFDKVSDLGASVVIGWLRYQVGVAYEDVTDWRGLSCVELEFTGAAEDIGVTMALTYQTLTGSDDNYVGATWNFGVGSGTATATWSANKTANFTGTLLASTGKVKFDLAPDAGLPPYNLCYVRKVELIFDAACEVTYVGWTTVCYDAAHPVNEVDMRLACRHSSDYFGARHNIDGMPNYKPNYLYVMDAERAEVGFKAVGEAQHNPDYEGDAQDLRHLKTLAEWNNEQLYGQVLLYPTYSQGSIDRDLKDADSNVLGTPVWGDYDEDGFALHVGLVNECGFFPCAYVVCDYILQGGTRGIAKTAGTRHTSQVNLVYLYSSIDNGTTKALIRTASTGYAGEYRVGPGMEKSPLKYWLDTFALGGFVNVEEVWAGTFIPGIGMLHLAFHPVSQELLLTDCGLLETIGQMRYGNGMGWSERSASTIDGAQTACMVTSNSRDVLVYGNGMRALTSPQVHLDGIWQPGDELDAGENIAWPLAVSQRGIFYLAAVDDDGNAKFFRFEGTDTYPRMAPTEAIIITSDAGKSAPAICAIENTWTMVAGIVVPTGLKLFASSDGGETWLDSITLEGVPLHPAICSLKSNVFVVTYHAETYLGATGTAKFYRVDASSVDWEASDLLAQFPCDEGRPALFVDPQTYELVLLVPKTQGWGIAGASPAVVEYRSWDYGETWSDPEVYGMT